MKQETDQAVFLLVQFFFLTRLLVLFSIHVIIYLDKHMPGL